MPPGEMIPDDRALRRLLDGAACAGRRLRHGGRLQRRLAEADAGRLAPTRSSPRSTACSSPTAGSAPSRARCRSRTGRSTTSSTQLADLRLHGPGHLPGRGRLPPERRADPRRWRVQRPQIAALKALGYSNARARLALREVGARDRRRSGRVARHRGRRLAGLGDDRPLQPVLPLPDPALPAVAAASRSRRSAIGLGAAALGAVFAVRRAVRDPAGRGHAARAAGPLPHEPRRAPAVRGASAHGARMVLRNVERQPWRALASVIGIAFAVGILLRRLRLHRRDGPARRDAVLAGRSGRT